MKLRWLQACVLLAAVSSSASAQQSFHYVYDGSGQLFRVIDSSGTQIQYDYDEVGNIVAIQRTTVGTGLQVFGFSPQRGAVGAVVTVQGQGYAQDPTANALTFNGTTARVLSVNASGTSLTARVPALATSGPIALAVNGNTVLSSSDFTILNLPVVAAVSPGFVFAGETVDVTVRGANLAGAAFSLEPDYATAALTASLVALSDAAATLQVTVSPDARSETFVVAARTGAGTSGSFSDLSNTLRVIDPNADDDFDNLTNAQERVAGTDPFRADTDGDGFPDNMELGLATDPLDAASSPRLTLPVDEVDSGVAILNREDLHERFGQSLGEAVGLGVSVLNAQNLHEVFGDSFGEADGFGVSISVP